MEAIDNYERLRMATPEQLLNFETDNIGIHWPELDEDLSYEGFFKADAMEERSELYVFEVNPKSWTVDYDANLVNLY